MTPHDIEVLRAYGRTGSINGAAAAMGRSRQTIKNELSAIYSELGVRSGVAAIYRTFVEPDDPPALRLVMACGCAPGTHDNTILAIEQAHPEQWVIDGIHEP